MSQKIIDTDVLVIGGAGAGLRVAIEAAENGVRSTLISKGPIAKSGASLLAGADFTLDGKSLRDLGFPGEPRDNKQKFFNDIVTQGFYLNNQKLVELYVQHAPDRIRELLDWGIKVKFSEERAIFTSGPSVLNSLARKAKHCGVEMINDTMLVDLLTKNEKVIGALSVDIKTGEFVTFKSKAVVLATGGWHKAYSFNAGTRELSGDGHAAAYRAGAELSNMEFVTFCPNVILEPLIWRGCIFLYVIHLLVGGELINSKGERFTSNYDPKVVEVGTSTEWNKCFLSVASMREVLDGKGSPHRGVYFRQDTSSEIFDNNVTKRYPNWKYKGIDFSELGRTLKEGGSIEVGPAAEYFEGGIIVNQQCGTSLKGLYAAGECTASLFGANRVAAATTEMLVEGAIAGKFAAKYAKKIEGSEINEQQVERLQEKVLCPLLREDGIKSVDLRRKVQEMAYSRLGPIRNRRDLEEFRESIERIKKTELPRVCTISKSRRYNKEWIETIELENIIQILEISATAALMRTESRGVHYRSDHPRTDNSNWLNEIVVKIKGQRPHLSSRRVITTKLVPPKGVIPYMEMLKRMMEAHSEIGGHH